MTDRPLVSIIIPNYNYDLYLREACYSAVMQAYTNIEIIIIDDCSTNPGTQEALDYCEKFGKVSVVKLIENIGNGGPAAVLNLGIQLSKGDLICALDSDDKINGLYIRDCVKILSEKPEYRICSSWVQSFGESNDVWECKPVQNVNELLEWNKIHVSSVFYREDWEKVKGYEINKPSEDWILWVKLADIGCKSYVIPKPYLFHRVHKGQRGEQSALRHYELANQLERDYKRTDKPEKTDLLCVLPYLPNGGASQVVKKLVKYFLDWNVKISLLITERSFSFQDKEVQSFRDLVSNQIFYKYNAEGVLELLEHAHPKTILLVGGRSFYDKIPKIKKLFPDIRIVDLLFNDVGHLQANRQYKDSIDYTITEYKALSELIKTKYRESRFKTSGVLSVIDNEKYLAGYKDINIYEKYNIPRDKKIFLFVGRMCNEKCIFQIMYLAQNLQYREDVIFVLAGDGQLMQYFKNDIQNKQLTNVFMIGNVLDVRPLYYHAIALILTSCIEGIPNVVLEALACRLPVISYQVGGVPEVITEGLGFIAPMRNNEKMKEHILKLLDNPKFTKTIRNNIRVYNKDNQVRFHAMAKEYAKILQIELPRPTKKHVMFVLPTVPTGGAGVYVRKLLQEFYQDNCTLSILMTKEDYNKCDPESVEFIELTKGNIYFRLNCLDIISLLNKTQVTTLFLVNCHESYKRAKLIKDYCPGIQIVDILFCDFHLKENLEQRKFLDHTFIEYTTFANQVEDLRQDDKEKLITTISQINNQRFLQGYDYKFDHIYDQYRIPRDKKIILYVGRIAIEKQLTDVLQVAKEMESQDALFLLLGEGQVKEELKNIVRAEKIKNVRFLGYSYEIRPFYQIATALILTSYAEGIPNVILEALVLELPVISQDVGGVAEIIEHGKLGYIVQDHKIEEYIKYINLLMNPEKSEQIKKNIREYNRGNAERFQVYLDKFRKVLL